MFGGGGSNQVQIIVGAVDNASKVLNGVGDSGSKLGNTLKAFGKAAAVGIGAATTAATAFGVASVKEFNKAKGVETRLTTLIMNRTGATLENVEALKKQAQQMQRTGVVSAQAIEAAQAKLAEFDFSSDAIKKVIPTFTDFAVQTNGVNVSMEQMADLANGLGKAMQGNLEVFTRNGFVVSESQKALLEHGNEMQRVEVIAQLFGKTYDGINNKMGAEFQGSLLHLNFLWSDFKEKIGGAIANGLQPLLVNILNTNSQGFTPLEGFLQRIIDKVQLWTTYLSELVANWKTNLKPSFDEMNRQVSNLVDGFSDLGFGTRNATDEAGNLNTKLNPLETTVLRFTDAVTSLAIGWNFVVDKLSDVFYWLIRVEDKIKSVASRISGVLSQIPGGGAARSIMNFLTPGKPFQFGGVVPGRPGQAVPIMAHGGEVISNPNIGQSVTNNNNATYNVTLNSDAAVWMFFSKMQDQERAAKFGVASA